MKKLISAKLPRVLIFVGFRLNYNKIILAKSCLAKFEKRLSVLYEQLSKCKRNGYKNKLIANALLKKIELYVWRFKRWASVVRRSVIKDWGVIAHNFDLNQTHGQSTLT